MIDTEDIVRQVVALEANAEAMLLHARILRRQLSVVMSLGSEMTQSSHSVTESVSVVSETKPVERLPCSKNCPPNWRKLVPLPGRPTRTVCKLCEREYN